MNRRELLQAAAVLPLAHSALSHAAFAQGAYPSRNITMIVPFPPGGQADLAARPVAQALEKILGKPVIVDNRAGGGGGSVGNAAGARAEPDGHTLLMTLSSLAVLPGADRLFDGASAPYGTLHVAMEMFAASACIKLLHVPFRGAGPALAALLGDTVQAMA